MTDYKIYQKVYDNSYFDSVMLMRLSTALGSLPGVHKVSVMMGTPANLALMSEQGLWDSQELRVRSIDMCVAVQYANKADLAAVQSALTEFVHNGSVRDVKSESKATVKQSVRSWVEGSKSLSDPKVAFISVPGPFAAVEAKRALDSGFHVFLFSNNVAIKDEVLLKRQAQSRGLIVMGPDCGTSLIGGIRLGFVNHLNSGSFGIVAASGTGAQEVSTALSRAGVGISHIIGTGGRDLSAEVGGISALQGLRWLGNDELTEKIVLISKPPAERVAKKLIQELKEIRKPAAVLFLGSSLTEEYSNVRVCSTLGEVIAWGTGSDMEQSPDLPKAKAPYIRALYVGGTFAHQASILIGVVSHSRAPKAWLENNHVVIDFGDDKYTVGRPHPMIDGAFRQEVIKEALLDKNTGVLICDVVLGDGAEDDPARRVVDAITEAYKTRRDAAFPVVIAHVVGTPLDSQGYDNQVQLLKSVGVHVTQTSTAAVRAALNSVN